MQMKTRGPDHSRIVYRRNTLEGVGGALISDYAASSEVEYLDDGGAR